MRYLVAAFLVLWCSLVAHAQPKIVDIGGGRNPKLVDDYQGHLWVVYEGLQAGDDIFVRRSDDDGRTWSDEINVSNTPGQSRNPAIAFEKDGGIDVVWQDTNSAQERPDIYFSHSADGGKTWSEAVDISNTPGVSKNPAIATGPNNSIHVVWSDDSNGTTNPDIFYAFSFNGGKSWSKPRDISTTPGVSSDPVVAVAKDNTVHVAWCDTSPGDARPDIFYTRGAGDEWARPINVSNTPGISRKPDIALDSYGHVYLTWADTSRTLNLWDIYFSKSDGGDTFTNPLFFNTPGDSKEPAIAIGPDDHLAIVWSDTSDNPKAPDIFLVQSNNFGASFTGPTNISRTPGVSKAPDVVVRHGLLIVVWEEVSNGKSTLRLVSQRQGRGHGPRR